MKKKLLFKNVSYISLYKVYETPRYFYLYLTKKYSFIVDKQGLSQGNGEEFQSFVKKKMWFKYSKYDKKCNQKVLNK